ncbi:MAG: fatty acid desaturase [SAR324 cluster bacterium]|uniref:Fatty acid desaturase domain-containing protein n=1 Tax=marine metagenome TaxID=408172 RepID=A0A381VBB3_9ZZZZ|nr:fatty acid desaturase [SAR324 cluster bacterium]
MKAWIWHLFGLGLTLGWVSGVCGIPFWEYLFLLAYPGTSFTLLRSFAEHRSHTECEGRTAVLEAESLFGILYLYNNYHALHHNTPDMAWYKLPALFREKREDLLKQNHGYLIRGYRNLFRKYLFNTKKIPYFA